MWPSGYHIFIFIVHLSSAASYKCDRTARVCETSLTVQHYLTMTHPVNSTVYPSRGKLYDYRVNDPSTSATVPVDDVITADGWEAKRLVIVVNRTLPGPDIVVYEGQTLIVHVTNSLASDSVTIHWHGLHQTGTPYMDGVPFVTQCPIAAGQTFTYEFQAYPSGTFWYHSHVGSQRTKGMFGALIILRNETNPIPEHILQIQEWNHNWDSDYGFEMMVYGLVENRTQFIPSESVDGTLFSLLKAHSGLINGRGRYYFNYETGSHNEAPLTVYKVKQGSVYRFRAIGVGALYPFRVSVDGHMITVIESDGFPIQPVTVESFIINPGERYDFTLVANQTIGNYWIRGRTLEMNRVTMAEAILRYDTAPENDPVTTRKECKVGDVCHVLNCPFQFYPASENIKCIFFDQLRSTVPNDPAPEVVEGRFSEYFLNFFSEGMVNGKMFKFPSVAALSQPSAITTQCEKCKGMKMMQMCMCTHTLNLDADDTVQIVLSNIGSQAGMSHPIHMHGHSFYVLKTGFGKYNATTGRFLSQTEDLACLGSLPKEQNMCDEVIWANQSWRNGNIPGLELNNPPRKDTITIPGGGYVVIRIKANNPGLWFLHCHIEFHATHGMGLLLNESFANVPKAPPGFPSCSNFEKVSSANVDSKETKVFAADTLFSGNISVTIFWIVVGVSAAVILSLIVALVIVLRSSRKAKTKGSFEAVACYHAEPR